ncbi:MAG: aspartate carbamoyltransferase [Candidatus Marinimicrobia bacterium]|nr:aspartate carbamoyltransferase [Candidatus Neomarinimicrobiota bacterium]
MKQYQDLSLKGKFMGRSVSVINDLSVDEQWYLYTKTHALKNAVAEKDDLSHFKINNTNVGAYLVFVEPSTRTKESFLNAVKFHNIKTNIFDATTSSFSKKESYSDTFRMLTTYSPYSLYIIRTKLEGVTRWLDYDLGQFAERMGIQKPSFINGGDGKHEHPTQEILDEYTFLEQNNFNRDYIHIALVGDLFHGRTIHSKADGLNIFKHVDVDLIAPNELAMPPHYKKKMESNGYNVREFASIEEYLAQKKIANIWYFTRLQLERMGEDILQHAERLTKSVTFRQEWIKQMKEGTKFYHPLPRNREYPTIPLFLDKTPLNGWDLQAMNGYYTRAILVGMLGGSLGEDFNGEHLVEKEKKVNYIEEVSTFTSVPKEFKIGTKPVENGIVIDHIGKGEDISTIWEHIYKARKILDLNVVSSHGVYKSHKDGQYKGVLSLPELNQFDLVKMKKLSAIAPESTLNIIKDSLVQKKFKIHFPPKIYEFDEISCKNPDCISHPLHSENAMPFFYKTESNTFICKYCDKDHNYKDVWDI